MILLILFMFLYHPIYTNFFKKKKVLEYEYCLTNLRVLKYNKKTNKLLEGQLREYQNIYTINVANNCGNVVFSKFPNTAGKNDIDEGQAQNIVFDNQTDVLIFEAIENPFHVKGYALETRNKLKK